MLTMENVHFNVIDLLSFTKKLNLDCVFDRKGNRAS